MCRTACLLVSGVLICMTGCATPVSRIQKNPELFASFPPEAQLLIQQGQIDIGFSTEMVTMALGVPDRIYSRQTVDAQLEVWSYTAKTERTERQRVRADVRTRGANGKATTSKEWVYIDVPRNTEYERLRVEFGDGKVVAIDTLQQ